jgi:predicted metalloprotease with PDZ domain
MCGVTVMTILQRARAAVLCSVLLTAVSIAAQSPGPQPLPMPAPLPVPVDRPYAGVIHLSVDATDVAHRIFRVRESIPLRDSGPVILLYPQWLPGNHSPRGRVDFIGGLIMRADGKRVEWRRDPVEVFAFHVTPPAGARTLEVEFDFNTPLDTGQGRVQVTPEMLNVQWNQVVLYPAGYFTRQIQVDADLTVPAGWKVATALDRRSAAGDTTTFTTVALETLVDSPVFAGLYADTFELDTSDGTRVRLNVVADRPELIAAKPEYLEPHKALVQEAYKLFGSHHYDHYDFLFGLTSQMGGIGLEHHRSSENVTVPEYFTEWARHPDERDLLPHEFTHSWNGKFRRPADLWTPNYNVPMRGSLLWVYEGQTQYWGQVLAARSGLWTRQQALDSLAMTAATYNENRPGREWKSLQDTTNDPITAQRRTLSWTTWQRSEDYYSEGELIWLDVDTLIRERSNGQKSLDDFAKAFFGIDPGSSVPVTYQFDDVVKALNVVLPHDWASFLRTRLEGHGPGAPLDGITRGGYKLVFNDTPSEFFRTVEGSGAVMQYSLGANINSTGQVTTVIWNRPMFKAGIVRGQQIVSVNGVAFSVQRLKTAVTENEKGDHPIVLLMKDGERYRRRRALPNGNDGLSRWAAVSASRTGSVNTGEAG